ncbi:MAG: acyl-CoA dehydrogenase [Candidatus Binatia bacterium]|nr:MAG: acyl-CoA dehydrogenase [Candidatus Binatia bacterium]
MPDCYPPLNETQTLVRDTIRKVVERELKPHVPKLEREEELPYPYIRKIVRALGLGGEGELTEAMKSAAPEDKLEFFLEAAVAIEIARVCGGVLMSWGVSFGQVGGTIRKYGTEEQKARYVPGLENGEIVGSWCLTEPGAGSDAFGSMRTTARPDGDFYVLNGQKTFITNAPYADVFVVYAKLEENGNRTIQPFLVERGTPGLETSKPFRKMGMHSAPTGAVYLDQVRIPKKNLLGGGVRQRDHVRARLADERAGMPTLSLGLADRAFEIALRYAKEREQFGQPIANFQLVQRRLARMYGLLCNMRSFVFLDFLAGRRVRTDMADICAGKLFCCEAATQITMDAIHILGGNGYMEEYEVERLARDAKLMELGGGTTEIQELTIARHILA